MKKFLLLSHCLLIAAYSLFAQNVGIGTNTPQKTLDVKGNQRIGGTGNFMTYDSASGKIVWNNSNLFVTGSQYLMQHSASAEGLFYGNGKLLYRGVTDTAFYTDWSTGDGYFRSKLGIGTTTPQEKLHVAGNVKADTIIPAAIKLIPGSGVGKILTSDAGGNASWQNRSTEGTVGFGTWGDCSMNGVSEYNPVADTASTPYNLLGSSVSLYGNFAIVGAYGDDIGSNQDQGSASIYWYNGTNWVFMQKLTDPTGGPSDYFGYSVFISGDHVIVGSYLDDVGGNSDQGSICFFHYNGSSWVFVQKLIDPLGATYDNFGESVCLSGNFAIAGAQSSNANKGSASIFQYNGTNWVYMTRLTDPNGAAFDAFGCSVSISGNYLVAGAMQENGTGGGLQGSASIYQYNGSSWAFIQKVFNPDAADNDFFGCSVSLSGNDLIVGSYADDILSNDDQGSASIFHNNGTNWILVQKLTAGNGSVADYFGYTVCIAGDLAIISNHGKDIGSNSDQGAADVFVRMGAGWQRLQYLSDPGGNAGDVFGLNVGIDAATRRFLIGVPGYSNNRGKAVFGKLN